MHFNGTYTVQTGDTLSGIAADLWTDDLHDLNKGTIGENPDLIKTGDKLVIPTPTGAQLYTVHEGDTLSELAGRRLWPWLFVANMAEIADPNKLKVGQVLNVPLLVERVE